MSLKDSRVAVQGFGNAGANIARLVAADGAKVVAACDSKSGLYSESGIDIHEALQHKEETGVVALVLRGVQRDRSGRRARQLIAIFSCPSALENASR